MTTPELKHVYEVLDISTRSQDALYKAGIKSVEHVVSRKRKLRNQILRGGVKEAAQKDLFDFVCWFMFFEKQWKRASNVLTEFKWEAK